MDLLKYFSKLKKMSADEILFRVRQQVRNRKEALRWRMNGKSDPGNLFIPNHIVEWDFEKNPFPDENIHFFGLTQSPETLRQAYRFHFSDRLDKFLQQADKLLEHRFHFLGIDVDLSDPIPWNRNPQTGLDYPKYHHWQMDIFNTDLFGDVKYVWELNPSIFYRNCQSLLSYRR